MKNSGAGAHKGKSPRYSPVGIQSDHASLGNQIGSSQRAEMSGVGGMSVSDALGADANVTPSVGHGKLVHNVREAQNQSPNFLTSSDSGWGLPYTSWESPDCKTKVGQSRSAETDGKLKYSTCQQKDSAFDICPGRSGSGVKLNRSLLEKNRERRNIKKNHVEGHNIDILRPGMVLLRGFLSLADQVKLIRTCQGLGLGSGGFYQPGYGDGAKLHLKMMCLGKNWDPETSLYSDERAIDGAKPPGIPYVFHQLVKGAIQECHAYLESCAEVRNAKYVIPSMSPNICIVNFYATSGKLGLHQDKDESKESLQKGLPVVSFSIGDSADFLYGDERNVDKAEKVVLKSGDVLIFGGNSRHIFHGVTTINPGTAPAALLEETNIRPGRLNLTFREY